MHLKVVGILLAAVALASEGRARTTKIEEQSFTLEVPPGWSRAPSEQVGSVQSLLITSADGGYFSVVVDPGAGDGRGDAWWKLEARGDRLAIVQEEPPCKFVNDPRVSAYPCPVGDGRLTISAGGVALKGHHFHFWFGNKKRETGVDLQPFREMLLSLRAK